MPIGVSGLFSIIETPHGDKKTDSSGYIDDFKWGEGRAPTYGSPLVPYLLHDWAKMRWSSPKIVPPKLSFQGINTNTGESQFYTMTYVTNKPTFITDHHIISLRKMIEDLWKPKFHAHIHLELSGEIFVKPLYSITHGQFKAAEYYEWLGSMIGLLGINKPYKLSVGGFYNNQSGHSHYWGAGASGSNTWKAKIYFDHGGSIKEEIGNYKIEKIEHNYILKKFYRKVFSQDGDGIWEKDYNAWTRKLHLPIYDSFDAQFLAGFVKDSGDYWSTDINTVPNDNGGRSPAYSLVPMQRSDWVGGGTVYVSRPLNIQWSACTLPSKETIESPWFSGGGATHDPISGYDIQIEHADMLSNSNNRFIQQSVYSPNLGESIAIKSSLSYFEEEISPGWKEGTSFEVNASKDDEIEIPTELGTTESGSRYITSLIGTRLVPMFRVTYRDLNDNIYTSTVTETELYGVDSYKSSITSDIQFPELNFDECN